MICQIQTVRDLWNSIPTVLFPYRNFRNFSTNFESIKGFGKSRGSVENPFSFSDISRVRSHRGTPGPVFHKAQDVNVARREDSQLRLPNFKSFIPDLVTPEPVYRVSRRIEGCRFASIEATIVENQSRWFSNFASSVRNRCPFATRVSFRSIRRAVSPYENRSVFHEMRIEPGLSQR